MLNVLILFTYVDKYFNLKIHIVYSKKKTKRLHHGIHIIINHNNYNNEIKYICIPQNVILYSFI